MQDTDTIDGLIEEYSSWTDGQGLPLESADDLILRDGLTKEQRDYLSEFISRWDDASRREYDAVWPGTWSRKVGSFQRKQFATVANSPASEVAESIAKLSAMMDRFYAGQELLPEEDRAGLSGTPWCLNMKDSQPCMRPKGHAGNHVSHGLRGEVVARWPQGEGESWS